MRPAQPSLTLLPCLLCLAGVLACGTASDASETGTAEPASSSGQNSDTTATSTSSSGSATGTAGDPTAGTTTDGDPTAGSSTTTGASTAVDTTGDVTVTEASSGDASTGAAEELPPIENVEALESWLAGGAYKQWAAESKVHASTGPHGGNVRTYVNAIALGSLAAQAAEHPQDAATVKELYGDSMDTLIGYAVALKTAPQSEGGATWYWYERINATVYGGGLDVPLCSGCHGDGADYILTPYPLQ
ncbi:MAG: hypothetical protein H0T76_11185 [Nannocystis sp.]|nr:hypothetical protein [Nannocystis sp.]